MDHFFPDNPPDVLYTTLNLTRNATAQDIRKAYRRLALLHHPDKQAAKSEHIKAEAAAEFQKIGFAYAVLSDAKRLKTYDATGQTVESAFADAEEMGWDAYFESLYTRVDRKMLDDDRNKYQGAQAPLFVLILGSEDERRDLKTAYITSEGSLPAILEQIPHATHDDEDRLINEVNTMIKDGSLKSIKTWTASSLDKNARKKRAKAGAKQAKEAEAAAKELGVWDEFYGKREPQNNSGASESSGPSGLEALILQRQKDRAGALDAMEKKYTKRASKRKSVSRAATLPDDRNLKSRMLSSRPSRLGCLREGKRRNSER